MRKKIGSKWVWANNPCSCIGCLTSNDKFGHEEVITIYDGMTQNISLRNKG